METTRILISMGPTHFSGVNLSARGTDQTQVQGFTDSGFRTEFRDESNQVQHFAAGVWAGYRFGLAARLGHRIARPDTPQDTSLNDESTSLGGQLGGDRPSLLPQGVRDYILGRICE